MHFPAHEESDHSHLDLGEHILASRYIIAENQSCFKVITFKQNSSFVICCKSVLFSSLFADSTQEEVKAELDKAMSKQLKSMGLEVESVTPSGLQSAVKQAMSRMGFPMRK